MTIPKNLTPEELWILSAACWGDLARAAALAGTAFQNIQAPKMARIPLAAQLLMTGTPRDLQKLLIAAILRSEDELLTITEADLAQAEHYTLVTTDIAEEKALVLTVRQK